MEEERRKPDLPVKSYRDLIAPALASIPAVGGALSSFWSQWDTNRKLERVESVLSELRVLLSSDRHPVDLDLLGGAHMELFEKALQQAQYEHADRKRRLFARIVASSWSDHVDSAPDEALLFVQALSEFSETHIRVLLLLDRAGPEAGVPYRDVRAAVAARGNPGGDPNLLTVGVLDSLAARYGFIKRAWGLNSPEQKTAVLISKNLSPEGIAKGCKHCITSLGAKFMDYLRDTEQVGALDGYSAAAP